MEETEHEISSNMQAIDRLFGSCFGPEENGQTSASTRERSNGQYSSCSSLPVYGEQQRLSPMPGRQDSAARSHVLVRAGEEEQQRSFAHGVAEETDFPAAPPAYYEESGGEGDAAHGQHDSMAAVAAEADITAVPPSYDVAEATGWVAAAQAAEVLPSYERVEIETDLEVCSSCVTSLHSCSLRAVSVLPPRSSCVAMNSKR